MLFPELAPANNLVGIAKLAANSAVLESKRQVEYREIETRRFIGKASGRKMPFDWTINPYRGCEFGCKYCYARYTHEFMELRQSEQFEREIFAKAFHADSFRREFGPYSRDPAGSASGQRPIRTSRRNVGSELRGISCPSSPLSRGGHSVSLRSRTCLPATWICSKSLLPGTCCTYS